MRRRITPEQHLDIVLNCESSASVIKHQILKDQADHQNKRLLHAAMGLVTESGELIDQLKKHLVYNQDLDIINAKEELGDILWYVQLALHALNSDIPEVLAMNVAKLKARFGNKFDFDKVLNRNLDKEREALEGAG